VEWVCSSSSGSQPILGVPIVVAHPNSAAVSPVCSPTPDKTTWRPATFSGASRKVSTTVPSSKAMRVRVYNHGWPSSQSRAARVASSASYTSPMMAPAGGYSQKHRL
jgi:hypothetical protein